jgi:hypothetical protein
MHRDNHIVDRLATTRIVFDDPDLGALCTRYI